MKLKFSFVVAFLLLPALCLATADGSWLRNVPNADRARTNPYASNPGAIAAGRNLFSNNCAKCHGENAEGKAKRPSLKSKRIQTATDGELAWLIKNGEAFKGMPGWGAMPERQRWQIIAYLRSLNPSISGVQQ